MTPVEKLEAAIERLTREREVSSAGPWRVNHDGILIGVDAPEFGYPVAFAGDIRVADAELIVTLHRTIHAQLVILTMELNRSKLDNKFDPGALLLADAILGGES